MLHMNMNNIVCSYIPQGLYSSFAAIVMRHNGFVPFSSSRILGDGYATA